MVGFKGFSCNFCHNIKQMVPCLEGMNVVNTEQMLQVKSIEVFVKKKTTKQHELHEKSYYA